MAKKKVMIIDDEEDFLKVVKLNLEQTGKYEVTIFSKAKDIVSHVHRCKPHLILLDILMPGIGGIEACERLNQDAVGQNIPIIILSALEKDEDKLKAYKVGVIDYITKPVKKDFLIAKIEKVLGY